MDWFLHGRDLRHERVKNIYWVSSVYTANFETLCANKVQSLKNISKGTKNQELDILNQLCNASIVSENDFDHAKKKNT